MTGNLWRAELAELATETWAMERVRLEAFLGQLERLSALPEAEIAAARSRSSSAEDAPPYQVVDGVAHIPIAGPILKSVPSWLAWFGITATGTLDLRASVERAVQDPAVSSLLLVVDSPGGTLGGLQEAADAIYAARSSKPVHASGSDLVASAAYWLASQAETLSAGASTYVGSIGVYRVLYDSSAAAADAGVKVRVVASGPLKGTGISGAPITDQQLAVEQELIDQACSMFVGAIARGRGVGRDQIEPAATGRVWFAADALELGLIDGVGSLPDAHRRVLAAGLARQSGVPPLLAGDVTAPQASAAAETAPAPDHPSAPAIGAAERTPAMSNPTTPAAPQAPASPDPRAAELERELALAKSERDIATKALAEVRAKQRAEVIERGVAEGRVTPALRESVDTFAALCGDDVARLEKFVGGLPQQTRPAQHGGAGATPAAEAAAAGSGDKIELSASDKACCEALGIPEALFASAQKVTGATTDGRAVIGYGKRAKRVELAQALAITPELRAEWQSMGLGDIEGKGGAEA